MLEAMDADIECLVIDETTLAMMAPDHMSDDCDCDCKDCD